MRNKNKKRRQNVLPEKSIKESKKKKIRRRNFQGPIVSNIAD